jgi:hypothetical protein
MRAELPCAAVVAAVSLLSTHHAFPGHRPGSTGPPSTRTACEGARPPLPVALPFRLRNGAFPDSGQVSVSVHVPEGFDASTRPGLIVYFHGWNGCVAAALGQDDTPCTAGGDPREASALIAQIDLARVNAVLVAVELRVDMPTGEPGNLAMPGGLRDLLRELLSDDLAKPLGCPIDVDSLDRVVIIAHSGGYQAAASVLELGDVPQIDEVVLLDALYGAEDAFATWIRDAPDRFGSPGERGLRFVDLYTCCGGTAEASRALAKTAEEALGRTGEALGRIGDKPVMVQDDTESEPDVASFQPSVVFKRVPAAHAALPRAYVRPIVEAAGFATIPPR